MESRVAPKVGKLYLRSYNDCFLHATASWLKYWNFSLGDHVAIVRVTLSNERSFLTTLSPTPLSYDLVRKGVSRDRYLEIDTRFAKELGITIPGTEVAVECVRDIERCTSLHVVPVNPDDYERLVDNSEKIEYELTEKIRVVSAQSFSFPIWITDNEVVPVRVVRSEPGAKWVLLVSATTVLRIEPSDAPNVPADVGTESLPERSSSEGSEDQTKASKFWDFSSKYRTERTRKQQSLSSSTGGGSVSSSTATSPETETESMSLSSSILAQLFGTTQKFLSMNIPLPIAGSLLSPTDTLSGKEQPQLTDTLSGKEQPQLTESADPPNSRAASTRSTHSDKRVPDGDSPVRPHHRRIRTWHSETEFGSGQGLRILPKYIGTPKMKAFLRVQPHSMHYNGTRLSTCRAETSLPLWNYERIFDVFVHPSSIPEVFHYVQHYPNVSVLVELKPVEPPYAQKPQSGAGDNTAQEPQPRNKGTEDPPDILTDMREFGLIAKSDQASKLPDRSSRSTEWFSRLSDGFASSLVVRLCFATKIQCSDKGITSVISGDKSKDINASMPKSFETPVAVGHIVMSHMVRQQLKISECSLVQLLHVKDEWKANPSYKKTTMLRLQPLKSQQHSRAIIISSFEEWIKQVSAVTELGAILVDKQVIPLKTYEGEWIPCKVAMRSGRLPQDESARIRFCMVTSKDITNKNVKLSVEQRVKDVSLPDMKSLNLPVITESREQFGGLEELENAGLQYLDSVFSEPGRSGALLICGLASSSGSGCGKSSLAKLLCKSASRPPYCAHVSMIDCTSLRGQSSPHRLKKRLTQLFDEAVWHQPSVLLLEKLDHAMPHVADAQEAVVDVDGSNGVKRAQVFLDCMAKVQREGAQVLVIATAQSKQQLLKDVVISRGQHIFKKVLEIAPPTLAGRKAILKAVMQSKDVTVLSDADLRDIALRTEGFQARDLVTLLDRAVSHSQVRPLQPFISHPAQSRLSTDSVPLVATQHSLSSFPGNPLSSSPKKHSVIKLGSSPQIQQLKKISIMSTESTVTLVQTDAEEKNQPRLEDFHSALQGFVPLSLQGLSLHSSGSVDFSSVGGLKEAKQTLKETLLWPSKYPRLFSQCTIKQRCGVLLYGAPGTGKTLLAGAVAKEFSLNFVSIKGPELLSKYIGASELAVRDIFTRAQSARPCILFFDEFDSLAPQRGHDRTGVTDRVVNQLLTQLDGVEALQGVYVLAASSRPDLIDPALLRPGRIDHSLFCEVPDQDARLEILKALCRGIPLDEDVDLKEIAEKTDGFTGADLKAVLYNAQLQAAHAALDSDMEHMTRETPEEGDRELRNDQRVSSERKKLVFHFNPSGLNKDYQIMDEQQVTKSKRRSIVQPGSQALRNKGKSRRLRAVITHAQLLNVLQDTKPSVSDQEKRKYSQIYDKFAGKTKTTLTDVTQQIATMA